jgi:hypothetical protein
MRRGVNAAQELNTTPRKQMQCHTRTHARTDTHTHAHTLTHAYIHKDAQHCTESNERWASRMEATAANDDPDPVRDTGLALGEPGALSPSNEPDATRVGATLALDGDMGGLSSTSIAAAEPTRWKALSLDDGDARGLLLPLARPGPPDEPRETGRDTGAGRVVPQATHASLSGAFSSVHASHAHSILCARDSLVGRLSQRGAAKQALLRQALPTASAQSSGLHEAPTKFSSDPLPRRPSVRHVV